MASQSNIGSLKMPYQFWNRYVCKSQKQGLTKSEGATLFQRVLAWKVVLHAADLSNEVCKDLVMFFAFC